MQAEKLVNVQDELAVQNCSLFLASSKALSSLSSSVSRDQYHELRCFCREVRTKSW